jgi:SAM-dependent methyltransferase
MPSYGPLCTAFYDGDKPTAPQDAVAYYRRRAADAMGAVLEPMCGSGRFLLPLLRAGIDIDGVDAAPAMLEACRRSAAREHLAPVLYGQRLEALALPRRYALAFVPSGSIGLVERSALPTALARLRHHLEPGATLLLELAQSADAPVGGADAPARVVRIDDATTITYTCQAGLTADGGAIRYEGRYEKRCGVDVIGVETESLLLCRHTPERFVELLAACGYVSARVVEGDAYPSLGASGCVLLEARVDAWHRADAR